MIDPELRKPVTELDMVRDVAIDGDAVSSRSRSPSPAARSATPSRTRSPSTSASLPGVERVELRFDVMSPDEKAALTTKLRGGRPEKSISLDPRRA